jgi:sortase A
MASQQHASPTTEARDSLPLLRALLDRPLRASQVDQASLDLLGTLLDAPPATATTRLAPVVLRSVDEQREHALRGFLRRTWVDRALTYVERGLIIGALLVFGWWFIDGPVRDWLHERSTSTIVTAAAPPQHHEQVVPSAAPTAPVASLPYVTSAMQQAEAEHAPPAPDDFIAPRRSNAEGPLAVATAPTRLIIPAINLDTPVKEVYVVDGVWQVAEYAAGYMHGTALPGEKGGNTALAGHAGLRGAVFKDLYQLKPGDDIYLDAGGWRYQYRVNGSTSVWPTQTEVLAATDKPILTLITCTNWDTQRLVVTADLIGSKPASAS